MFNRLIINKIKDQREYVPGIEIVYLVCIYLVLRTFKLLLKVVLALGSQLSARSRPQLWKKTPAQENTSGSLINDYFVRGESQLVAADSWLLVFQPITFFDRKQFPVWKFSRLTTESVTKPEQGAHPQYSCLTVDRKQEQQQEEEQQLRWNARMKGTMDTL